MFFDLSPKSEEMKAKINKWNVIRLTSICIAKEINNKMKRQPTEWEKKCGNDMTNKRLMPSIYINKQLIQLNIQKTNNPIKKKRIGKMTEQTFFQKGNADVQQAHEKVLNIVNH